MSMNYVCHTLHIVVTYWFVLSFLVEILKLKIGHVLEYHSHPHFSIMFMLICFGYLLLCTNFQEHMTFAQFSFIQLAYIVLLPYG